MSISTGRLLMAMVLETRDLDISFPRTGTAATMDFPFLSAHIGSAVV